MPNIINIEENNNTKPQAILAGLRTDSRFSTNWDKISANPDILAFPGAETFNPSGSDFDHSMNEMISLIEACDMEVPAMITQTLEHPDNTTYLGKGKANELAELAHEFHAEYCIFEGNLSPAQMKNLQEIVGVPVWDRTNLILEIFSRRAKTREARLQVESAYLQYMLPRLTGMWQHLGRQGGGSGSRSNKGIGETQLELDRRHINHRIAELSKELEVISRTREVQRQGRKRGEIPSVALVGYTNAGKSSMMNRLLSLSAADGNDDKQVFEKDMLFATLDTSIRHIYQENHMDFLLSDTVGFIENLPHGLVKAFRSTLEEVKYADLLLIVLDSSDPYHRQHRKVTEDTLKELEAGDIPRLYVMNKSDLLPDDDSRPIVANENTIYVSTRTGSGIPELLKAITDIVYSGTRTMELLIPYSRGDLLGRLHKNATVLSEEYVAEGTKVTATCPGRLADELREFEV